MFVINDEPVIKWPVKVQLPGDGGIAVTHEFVAHIRLLEPDEYSQQSRVMAAPTVAETLAASAEKLAAFIVGWDAVVDVDKQAVVFSSAALRAAVCGRTGLFVSRALWQAVHDVHLQAPAKN